MAQLLKSSTRLWPFRFAGVATRPNGARLVHARSGAQHTGGQVDFMRTLQALERGIAGRGNANGDELLDNLHALHKGRYSIPITYFMDTSSILCARNDQTRAELLIHLCRDNIQQTRDPDAVHKFDHDNERHDPVSRLVTKTLSSLHRFNGSEGAAQFWVKMSNNGYKTNRATMESILDSLASSSRGAPSLEFISTFHAAMQAHLWHQTPWYYTSMMKVLRQHIQAHCTNLDRLKAAVSKLDELWMDAGRTLIVEDSSSADLTALPLELYAARVSVYTSATHAAHQRGLATSGDATVSFRAGALKAFEEFVQRTSTAGALSGGCDDATLLALGQEMRAVLLECPTGVREITLPQAVKTGRHGDNTRLFQSQAYVRGSVQRLLNELAVQGQTSEAVALLGTFLRSRHTGTVEGSSRGGAASQGGTPASDLKGDQAQTALTSILTALTAHSRGDTTRGQRVGPAPAVSRAEASAEQLRADERTWQAELVCSLMRNSNAAVPALQHTEGDLAKRVVEGLDNTYISLREHLLEHQLKPGARFYAAYLYALRNNMRYLLREAREAQGAGQGEGRASAAASGTLSWSEALEAANRFLAKAPVSVRAGEEVVEAFVEMLSQPSGNGAHDSGGVLEAHKVLLEATRRGVSLSSNAHSALLEGAIQSLDDSNLSSVLSAVEAIVLQTKRASHGEDTNRDPGMRSLLRQRILAHCRLREAHVALDLLRELKRAGEVVDLRTYHWILQALYHSRPSNQEQRELYSDPAKTADFLLREISRDGHAPTSRTLALLLRLRTAALDRPTPAESRGDAAAEGVTETEQGAGDRALLEHEQLNGAGSHNAAVIAEMGRLLEKYPKLVDAHAVREVVKAHCYIGDPTAALEALQGVTERYKLPPSAVAYEPVLFHFAVLQGNLNAAEDILMTLVNRAIPLTDAVVAAFAVGLMRYGELSEALDTVQDMYNQHRVLPPATVWTGLLDASLSKGDGMEARRVVFLLKQLCSPAVRANMVGWALPATEETPLVAAPVSSTEGAEAAAFMRKLSEVQQADEKIDSQLTRMHARRRHALSAYWDPKPRARQETGTGEPHDEGVEQAPGSVTAPKTPAPVPGYLIRLGVPFGQAERGALSDEGLERRFKRYGLRL